MHHYQWVVLFLGLTSAVTIFTNVLKPVTSYLRTLGWRGCLYIDDVISGARLEGESHYWRLFVNDLLGRCGWCINPEKGQSPTQTPIFLGFKCNNLRRKFEVPEEKLERVLRASNSY